MGICPMCGCYIDPGEPCCPDCGFAGGSSTVVEEEKLDFSAFDEVILLRSLKSMDMIWMTLKEVSFRIGKLKRYMRSWDDGKEVLFLQLSE